jgi:hypothetical protein
MHHQGAGVPQDFVEAYKWYNLAAARFVHPQGVDRAVQARDAVAGQMTPEQIAEAQRLTREWRRE